MNIDIKDDLVDPEERNTITIDDEINNFLENDEGQNIKADIETLNIMGFDKKMINKVYILLRPENIERAIDYMTEIDGIYQHDFIPSSNPNEKTLCFICKQPQKNHLDYIPSDLLIDAQINNIPYNAPQLIEDIDDDIFLADKKDDKKDDNVANIDECEVCYDEISQEDQKLNKMPCGHLFCTHCWFNYLKTSILEAKVDKLKCMEHGCNEIVSEDFIMRHISENNELIEKYNKFKKRAEIIKDKNKKICPKPDCDSFLQKSQTSKYVECENGHKYCFDCLKPPHGNNQCDFNMEKQFMKWKKGKRVKRCPRCQMYTEKNEGCNHMTCVSCKYQWCWLCEGEYRYGHYDTGKCKGLQFTRADNLKCLCLRTFGLHKIFKCVYPEVTGQVPDFDELGLWVKYLLILGFWIFGIPVIWAYIIINYTEELNLSEGDCEFILYCFICIGIGLALLICFQITFSCFVAPFILVCFIYHRFFERLLLCFGLGDI